MWKKYKYYLRDLDCANCAREIEEGLEKKIHYKNVSINFSKLTLTLETDYVENVLESVQKDVSSIEKEVLVLECLEEKKNTSYDLLLLLLGLLFYVGSLVSKDFSIISVLLCIMSYVILGYKTFFKACILLKQRILNENFLIVVSAIGAFCISKPNEGFMVLFLYELGKYFEKRATGNVRKNVTELMNLKPTVAHRKNHESYDSVNPEEVKIGDVLVVLTGEKIPLDGILLSDLGEIDTSSLTGEAKVTLASFGDEILSGTINIGGVIEIKVTSIYEDSTVKRILDLMEHASDKKANVENFVNRASRYYTPIMLGIAIFIFFITPFIFSISFSESFYRSLMILVVSCPCAIAISVPLCYFAGLGSMSKHGILVKGSSYIDALTKMKYMVFDKTGTLTTGNFGIIETKVLNKNYKVDEMISYLVYGESYSNHPLARSIVNQYQDIKIPKISRVKEIKGQGISYEYQNRKIRLGNAKFVGYTKSQDDYHTIIYISVDEEVIGYVVLGDELKENASLIVKELEREGINIVMYTGDNSSSAKYTSDRLGIRQFEAELLPDDKFHCFEKLKEEHSEELVVFVGDGINDAPVLRLSDCGISMGSGSESAIEASDVVIISSDLDKILTSRKIANNTLRILKQNLAFALGIKFIVLLFSFFGIGTMWMAVFADVGVTILTILNSLRILR